MKKDKKTEDNEINIKIAELSGWHDICYHDVEFMGEFKKVWYGWHPILNPKKTCKYETPLPEFTEDMNAMYEAEKKMTRGQQRKYTKLLKSKYVDNLSGDWCLLHKGSRDRAEAFIKAMEEV